MEKLFNVTEAAEYLKVSTRTARQWLVDGELRGSKVGRQWIAKLSDIEAFIDARRNEPRDES